MPFVVNLDHIDTCLPCYLQDHHTRNGECLLGVALHNEMTYRQVWTALLAEWNQADPNGWPDDTAQGEALDGLIEVEIAAWFNDLLPSTIPGKVALDCPFDSSLDVGPDDECDGESPTAWFLIMWNKEEDAE